MADSKESAGCTLTIGGFVAAFLSYKLNGSILWAIFHFLCGWIYVAYVVIFRFAEVRHIFQ